MSDSNLKFEVAIVGFGPTGAALANILGSAGIRALVIEKESGVYPLPRAIHFDGEVMRILQSIGLRAPALEISRPGIQGMHFVNAAGDTLMIRGGSDANGIHGCANNYYFHQPELEAVLRAGCDRFPNVQIRLMSELTGIDDDGSGVQLEILDHATGQTSKVHARFVVGCDGARSFVRKIMGSPMTDLGLEQPWLVFDVTLKRAVELPTYTLQICDPQRPMTYCNVTGNRRRWEIMVMPGDDPQNLLEPSTLWNLVAKWVTPADASLERAAIYTFHSVIAQGWRKGRLLLAGDACHQTPPFLGQGMCAGIRDASNLGWKLIEVLRGCDETLLDSYEVERAPHVRKLIELAVRLGSIIQTTDPELARQRDARFAAGGPEVFEVPSQSLGGLAAGTGIHKAVGCPFPQPVMDDGRLLDDVLGRRTAVIGRVKVVRHVAASVRRGWERKGVIVIDSPDSALERWLTANEVEAVVVRPDRYVAGVASTPLELERVSNSLPGAVTAPGEPLHA